MCQLTLTAGLCLIIASLASSSRLVCYFNSLAENRTTDGKFTVSDIDPNQCTHLIYAFSNINNLHELVPSSAVDTQRYLSFNGLKNKNPQLKTLLAVGGLNFNTKKFSRMVSRKDNRQKFIQSAIILLRANGFDGLNLDWRYPGGAGSRPLDKKRFTMLCKELKDTFVAEGTANPQIDRLIVTATVSAERETIDASYEVAEIAKHLDFINVMTFDFHGPWEKVTGHHSPLYHGSQDTGDKIYLNTDSAMKYWRDQGAPTQKLNMGFAAYGRVFELSSASSDVGAPAIGAGQEGYYTNQEGFWSYYETCLYLEGVTIQMITDQEVPYATTDKQWVGFDNKDSLGTKVSYLKANTFGGAFVWSLDLDDFSGQFCKQGNFPFISHLHTLLVQGFPCNGKSYGVYANPADRNTFYNCAGQRAYIQNCPENLVFNPTCKCCDWPEPRTIPTHPTGPGENPCIEKSDGVYANPADQNTFYNCAGQFAYIQSCPKDLVFNPTCKCCDWPEPRTIPTHPTGPGENPCIEKSDGVYANPADRNTFYNCAGQRAHIQPCPKDLVFNPTCKCCDWPEPRTIPTHPTGENPCIEKSNGVYANPADRNTFYNCAGQFAYIQSCPKDLVFNPTCKCCDWPEPRTIPTPYGTW